MSLLSSMQDNLPIELPDQLQRIDRFWQDYRANTSSAAPAVISSELATRLGELDADVAICGGTLGILIGCALQQRGWQVILIEQGLLQGRAQEWNISRQELEVFLELGLLTERELATTIASEFNPVRIGFHGGIELWVEDILNIGINPSFLLATLKAKFLAAGGKLLEQTAFDRAAVYADGVQIWGTSSGRAVLVKARLLLDVMGHFSPIARQARQITQGHLQPDGVCMVVGGCAQGLPDQSYGDLIYTFAPIHQQCQYFWEAFPARDGRTTYMFTYVDADLRRPSFEDLLEHYLEQLPIYQQTDLASIAFQRVLMGFFPAYQNSPLQTPWPRILQVGDSSGMQSPLSFGGFGAVVRHLARLTEGIDTCLTHDFLAVGDLRSLQPYQPNLSVTWLFQKSMSVGVEQKIPADRINRLLSNTFTAMEKLGDPVLRPFLQDIVQFPALSQTMLAMAVVNPGLVLQIIQQVGIGTLLDWSKHYVNLGGYAALDSFACAKGDRLGSILESASRNLLPEQRYRWRCWQQAWRFGAGGDYR
jgi:lycopene cyclase CruP